MANLSNEFAIPLKVVTARCQHLKASFKGIFNKIESKAIKGFVAQRFHNYMILKVLIIF
ncbi:hypothetical protein HYG89_12875 [Acinetobacter sp. SwsAc5]|uniref:hypothetical protein n=1 Tax=Acinetobacter sp. SwsAc5 TaxID=2749438 RepID=UPI0015BEA981|nr:hypothetical protein [Acinetobacter sp. SwsAc5]NWK53424.1 hypothetical protein [Acinetobacter sp. SwsAc5]